MRAGPRSLQGRLLVLVLAAVALGWSAAAALVALDVRHELDATFPEHSAEST